jgi:uncharacterized cupredoxin-like copper-binding protein
MKGKVMPRLTPLLVPLAVLLVAACSATATPTPAATSFGPMTIDVKLSDDLRMEPTSITVKAGQLVHFVVTNTGATNHEFFLGDTAAQMKHGEDMMGAPGMMHDEPSGIGLEPGMMKTLDFTFTTAGTYEAGCHVNDHYGAGMKMAITVEP